MSDRLRRAYAERERIRERIEKTGRVEAMALLLTSTSRSGSWVYKLATGYLEAVAVDRDLARLDLAEAEAEIAYAEAERDGIDIGEDAG